METVKIRVLHDSIRELYEAKVNIPDNMVRTVCMKRDYQEESNRFLSQK